MALPDGLDSWSPVAALAALTLGTIVALARPTLPVRLALALGTAAFAAGVFAPVRETIPSYNRLLGAYVGVFGLAALDAAVIADLPRVVGARAQPLDRRRDVCVSVHGTRSGRRRPDGYGRRPDFCRRRTYHVV